MVRVGVVIRIALVMVVGAGGLVLGVMVKVMSFIEMVVITIVVVVRVAIRVLLMTYFALLISTCLRLVVTAGTGVISILCSQVGLAGYGLDFVSVSIRLESSARSSDG